MQAVIFDLDGTLMDTALDFYQVLNALRAEDGIPSLDFAELRLWVAKGANVLVAKSFGLEPGQPDFEEIKAKFLDKYEAELGVHAALFPGMAQLLDSLNKRQIPWAIVTDKFERFTRPLLSHCPWAHDAIVVSGDSVTERKPSPMPLLEACRRLGVEPTQAVYIGDGARDMQAGQAAGMKTIAALYGYIEPDTDVQAWAADAYVEDVEQLSHALDRLLLNHAQSGKLARS